MGERQLGLAMLLQPRNRPEHDLPRPTAAPRTYVIASTPRCGSTLLCHALWSTARVGAPREYLNPAQLRDWTLRLGPGWLLKGPAPPTSQALTRGPLPQTALRRYLDAIRARRSGPTGWFGLKVHHHHLVRWLGEADLEAVLGPIHWIHLRREDRIGQALSWVRARQTGRWASHAPGLLPPRYDPHAIRAASDALILAENDWRARWRRAGVRPLLTLTYEELCAAPRACVNRVLRALGEPPVQVLPAPSLHPQADARTAEWRARYLARPLAAGYQPP